MNFTYLESETGLDDLVEQFEAGTWPLDRFKHTEHLAIAACYVWDFGAGEALDLMRDALKRYLAAVGIVSGVFESGGRGYHETLTVFWIYTVSRYVEPGMTRLDAARTVIARLGTRRDAWKAHWSYDLLTDAKSRLEWVPPDVEFRE